VGEEELIVFAKLLFIQSPEFDGGRTRKELDSQLYPNLTNERIRKFLKSFKNNHNDRTRRI
jgi:hypothetical protein